MAEERSDADRTEEPTARRLEEARRQGRVVQSREVATFLLFGTAALLMTLLLPFAASRSALELGGLLQGAHRATLGGAGLDLAVWSALIGAAWPWLAGVAVLAVAAGLGPVLQGAVALSVQPLAPKLERISPLKGIGRLLSTDALLDFAKGIAKLAVVGGAAGLVAWLGRHHLVASTAVAPGAAIGDVAGLALAMLAAATATAALVVGLDWLHQRTKFMAEMRMTRQELKEELKESDGNPEIKQRLRQLRMERARRRMMAELPRATVVVTNPTHVAVALRYAADTPIPVVMAKGVDHVALAIREKARELGIPLVENPPLARALVAACEPGEPIPVGYYEAVAQVIAFLMRLQRERAARPH